jgi:hypothetical protein
MNYRFQALTAAVCLFGFATMANSITELGTVVPGTPASPGSDQGFLNNLLTAYNSGTRGTWWVPGAPGGGNYTYNINPGSALPTTLNSLPTLNGLYQLGNMNGITGSRSVTISLAGITADYITIKWGQGFEAYYVHGLTGSVTLGNDINRNGISGYTYWNGGGQVPDGGTTIALLGLGLAGIWLFARTQKFI